MWTTVTMTGKTGMFLITANFTCLVFQLIFKQIQIHPMEFLLKQEILCLVDVVCSMRKR